MARRQPRKPSIGLNSCSSAARRFSFSALTPVVRDDLGDLGLRVRQELVQGRIEQADGDRQSAHDGEERGEVGALHRQELLQGGAAARLVVGEDHLAHGDDAVALEEHVLGAAQADALGAESARRLGVARRVGVGAHLELAGRVGPAHQGRELARQLRLDHGDGAVQHLAGRAVDGDDVALLQLGAGDRHGAAAVIDADRAGAGHARLAHAARHHGGVRGHAAAGRQDAFGGVHAVDVLRRGLDAHEDHLSARPCGRLPRRRS